MTMACAECGLVLPTSFACKNGKKPPDAWHWRFGLPVGDDRVCDHCEPLMSKFRETVLEHVPGRDDPATARAIQNAIGFNTVTSVRHYLNALVDEGAIRKSMELFRNNQPQAVYWRPDK